MPVVEAMGESHYRYDDPSERGSVARPSFPGYLTSGASFLPPHQPFVSTDLQSTSPDFPKREMNPMRPVAYGLDDAAGIGVRPEPSIGAVNSGVSVKDYSPPVEDPNLIGHRRDVALGISPTVPNMSNGIPASLRNVDGSPVAKDSNILYVDGLPTDCTRREVAHLFRPFIGYRDIKVVHKEPRRTGDRARVFCFVEFMDPKCALTAMKALDGYKFDDRKVEVLRIQFAHFPFRPPSDSEQQ